MHHCGAHCSPIVRPVHRGGLGAWALLIVYIGTCSGAHSAEGKKTTG